jgi:hypothetical protein
MQDKQDAILAERLAVNPNDFMANLVKGKAQMDASKWDEAIATLQKAVAAKDDALALTFLGFCYNNKYHPRRPDPRNAPSPDPSAAACQLVVHARQYQLQLGTS